MSLWNVSRSSLYFPVNWLSFSSAPPNSAESFVVLWVGQRSSSECFFQGCIKNTISTRAINCVSSPQVNIAEWGHHVLWRDGRYCIGRVVYVKFSIDQRSARKVSTLCPVLIPCARNELVRFQHQLIVLCLTSSLCSNLFILTLFCPILILRTHFEDLTPRRNNLFPSWFGIRSSL